jgi:hypothetical protein
LQLSRQLECDGIPAALVGLHGGGYQQPSTKSLEHVLYNLISGIPSVYIIIDSLDECTERQEMLEWIKGIVSRKISTLHMVVVSRPERDIEDAFRLLDARCRMDLAKESERDIMMYLKRQLSALQKWDEETRKIIQSTLAERSEGMYEYFDQFTTLYLVLTLFQVPMGGLAANRVEKMPEPGFSNEATQ